jgi:medium-chain acyl-[acyl-carrier-protein] hydrolase
MQDWIVCPRPRAAPAFRLFCFPYAGAGIAAFRSWGEYLSPEVEVCCIQMPGREHRWRERPVISFDELIPQLTLALGRFSDLPYAFYGHSIGARVAFEVALELGKTGPSRPSHLFVGASPAPQIPWSYPPIVQLPEAELVAEVGRRYGSIPPAVLEDNELRQLVVRSLRADFSLIENYRRPSSGLVDCPLSAFAGSEDSTVPLSHIEAWRSRTMASFELHTIPGDHFFLQSARNSLLESIDGKLTGLTAGVWAND